MGDDSSSVRRGGLAEHHKLDPLGDAVKERDEALQDGVIHRAAVHHEAVVVLKLERQRLSFTQKTTAYSHPGTFYDHIRTIDDKIFIIFLITDMI